jgi:ADP-ribose pyrophosphatase
MPGGDFSSGTSIPCRRYTMPVRAWTKIRESVVSKNLWWSYKLDEYLLPSGKGGEYHYVHTNGSSMIVPVTNDGKLLLVKQFRYLVNRESIEFPCGSVKDGSTYRETALNELNEETGFIAELVTQVGEFNPYNGISDEMCRVYLARKLTFVGGVPDETEEFELLTMTAQDVEESIRSGVLWDGMSLAAWHIALPHIHEHIQ